LAKQVKKEYSKFTKSTATKPLAKLKDQQNKLPKPDTTTKQDATAVKTNQDATTVKN